MPTTIRLVLAPAVVLAAVLVTACVTAGSRPPSAPPETTAPATASPSDGSPRSEPGGAGGGAPGNPGSGSGIIVPIGPTPLEPGAGQPTIVMPKPGRLNPHPVAPIRLELKVEARLVLVKVSWDGGVAPCSVLDSVSVSRTGMSISLTVLEGADEGDGACPEIAMLKATIVDLGELGPGTWTIAATNTDLAPIHVTIP